MSWDDYKSEFRGPFFRLVEGVLKVFVPETRKTNNALGQDIRRSLKWWRKDRLGMGKTSDQPRRVLAIF